MNRARQTNCVHGYRAQSTRTDGSTLCQGWGRAAMLLQARAPANKERVCAYLDSMYDSMGGHVHTRLRSPCTLFTRPTEGQNLLALDQGAGKAARSRLYGCVHESAILQKWRRVRRGAQARTHRVYIGAHATTIIYASKSVHRAGHEGMRMVSTYTAAAVWGAFFSGLSATSILPSSTCTQIRTHHFQYVSRLGSAASWVPCIHTV